MGLDKIMIQGDEGEEGMDTVYAVFEGTKILQKSFSKQTCIGYRNSFPEDRRRKMLMAYKIIAGEYQQSHWTFYKEEEE